MLAETGYDGMTIDMVAARAKAGKATLYRRWASKAELVLDAVACMKSSDVDLDRLPDTGTLRGDAGRCDEALEWYRIALDRNGSEPAREFLRRRVAECDGHR